MLDTVVCDC